MWDKPVIVYNCAYLLAWCLGVRFDKPSSPCPKPWPYFGNLIEVARYGGLHKAFFIEYGKNMKYRNIVYKMYLGRSLMITIANPEMLKHILIKDFHKFHNSPDVMRGNVPLDKGLFDAKDEAWRKVRSVLTPTFSALKLRELVPLIDDAVDILLKRLQQRIHFFCQRNALNSPPSIH